MQATLANSPREGALVLLYLTSEGGKAELHGLRIKSKTAARKSGGWDKKRKWRKKTTSVSFHQQQDFSSPTKSSTSH